MMVTTSNGFAEFTEGAMTNRWELRHTYTINNFGLIYMAEPNLTSDGHRLVFIGQALGGLVQVYRAERADVATRFDGGALALFSSTGPPGSPYLTADCQRLYFVDKNTNQAMRAGP